MKPPWQERVAWDHIDGNPNNNNRNNLRLVHVKTGNDLTDQEIDQYIAWLNRALARAM
jgi:hypothetical protein